MAMKASLLLVSLVLATASAGQQALARSTQARQVAQVPSFVLDAEELLRQGSTAEAKQKLQEQLTLHPSSVEGYNLLGIICAGEKDDADALDAFQHALRLDANSPRTHNNLGNLYVAQEKF